MSDPTASAIAAQVVLPCDDLDTTQAFFVERLGFRLDAIHPADDPSVAVLSGPGLTVRLERGRDASAGGRGVLRLAYVDGAVPDGAVSTGTGGGASPRLMAPNGTIIELAAGDGEVVVPPLKPSFVVSRAEAGRWVVGRAGMRYRDLIPDRQGGRFIASHIHIPNGGPVPDYVHFHRIRFQLIFCRRGWVRVVYEDQGPPFTLVAGDCVLQPPEIRHRVLESSDDLEVIELGCPADHETVVEHELALPTERLAPERSFGGQRFVRHQAATASWSPWHVDGFVCRDTGIADATSGLAGVRVVRADVGAAAGGLGALRQHDGELLFVFVLAGTVTLEGDDRDPLALAPGDSVVVPPAWVHRWAGWSADVELLEVTLPAG
jgi:quercetin dioxygenase-like cupin family protein